MKLFKKESIILSSTGDDLEIEDATFQYAKVETRNTNDFPRNFLRYINKITCGLKLVRWQFFPTTIRRFAHLEKNKKASSIDLKVTYLLRSEVQSRII